MTIQTILDFSIDHAAIYIALFSASVVTVVSTGIWAFGRFHERATRRRGPEISG